MSTKSTQRLSSSEFPHGATGTNYITNNLHVCFNKANIALQFHHVQLDDPDNLGNLTYVLTYIYLENRSEAPNL